MRPSTSRRSGRRETENRPRPISQREPDRQATNFDTSYFERMLAAFSTTVDSISTDADTGAISVKPIETIAALSTLAGRILGIAEKASGETAADEVLDHFRNIVAANLEIARASFELEEAAH